MCVLFRYIPFDLISSPPHRSCSIQPVSKRMHTHPCYSNIIPYFCYLECVWCNTSTYPIEFSWLLLCNYFDLPCSLLLQKCMHIMWMFSFSPPSIYNEWTLNDYYIDSFYSIELSALVFLRPVQKLLIHYWGNVQSGNEFIWLSITRILYLWSLASDFGSAGMRVHELFVYNVHAIC